MKYNGKELEETNGDKLPCFNCKGLGYIQVGVSKIPCPTCKGKNLLTKKEETELTKRKFLVTYHDEREVLADNEEEAECIAADSMFPENIPNWWKLKAKEI